MLWKQSPCKFIDRSSFPPLSFLFFPSFPTGACDSSCVNTLHFFRWKYRKKKFVSRSLDSVESTRTTTTPNLINNLSIWCFSQINSRIIISNNIYSRENVLNAIGEGWFTRIYIIIYVYRALTSRTTNHVQKYGWKIVFAHQTNCVSQFPFFFSINLMKRSLSHVDSDVEKANCVLGNRISN